MEANKTVLRFDLELPAEVMRQFGTACLEAAISHIESLAASSCSNLGGANEIVKLLREPTGQGCTIS
jgi:hypothetical protein